MQGPDFMAQPLYTHTTQLSTGWEAGWTLWNRVKSLATAGNRTPTVLPVTRLYTG
jgi:hypothetical protein